MYLVRPSSRAGPKTPVIAVGESSSLAGGHLEVWCESVTHSTPRVIRGGERPNRMRACWVRNKEGHIAAAWPEVPNELQDKLYHMVIQLAKSVRWPDRQEKVASPGQ